MQISKTLKSLMSERNLSVKDLSKLSGIPVSTLHEWLGGRTPRDLVKVKKVAEALKISFNQLLFGEPDEHESISLQQLLKEDLFSGTFEVNIKRVHIKKEEQ